METNSSFKCHLCNKHLIRFDDPLIYDHRCYLDNLFSRIKKNEMKIEVETEGETPIILQKGEQLPKQEIVVYSIENEENKYFLQHRFKLNFDLKYVTLIKNFFLMCPEKMPKFYAINKSILSMNSLQPDRYLEQTFLYYDSLYRESIRKKIDEFLSSEINLRIHLKGLMGSGKSYFLSDYVLRKRVERQLAKFRILYINNSEQFLRHPFSYLFNELIYMICFDFENGGFDFKKWFAILYNNPSKSDNKKNYMQFFYELKAYYNKNKIKFILIWDQINVIYREENKGNEPGLSLYNNMTKEYCTFFNHIILSASNNNKEINIGFEEITTIEINPFEVFNKMEFRSLIEGEVATFKLIPVDVKGEELPHYLSELCDILNFSITEYYFYKSMAWDDELLCFYIKDSLAKSSQNKYFEARKIAIQNSEQKFRNEYLTYINDIIRYNSILRKIQVYNEKIHIFEETTVKEKPTVYNKQLLFYITKDKVLVCTSSLIRNTIVNLILDLPSKSHLIPWKNLDYLRNGNMFQLQVQSYYLNNQNRIIFGDKMQFNIIKKHFFYDCLNTLQELSYCKENGTSILCHFLQPNHFAFDSMLYDGETQTLILIQITIDKNHEIHYDKIADFIENKPGQLKIGEKKDFFKKYILFFQHLNKLELVKKYIYQWMTDRIYDEIIKNSDKEKIKLEKPNILEIIPFHKDLINEINKY